jgi:hypothetical protein
MMRLVLTPTSHPLKRRVDLHMMQFDPVAIQQLMVQLGIEVSDEGSVA